MAAANLQDLTTNQVQVSHSRSIYQDGLQGCEIRQSGEGRGMGIFATRDITPGTILLSEKPLLISVEIGTRAGMLIFHYSFTSLLQISRIE